MQLTIDVKESAFDKVMYLLNHLKPDVKIVNSESTDSLDIEPILESDEDYRYIIMGRDERKMNPQNYGTEDDINWH